MDVTKTWREVSHESFVFTSSTFTFWGEYQAMNVTKQWLSQSNGCHKVMGATKQWLSQSNGCHKDLEGGLARKLSFHILIFHFLREDSHESFVFTSSTFTFWGKSRTKCVFERMHEMLCFAGQNVSRKMCGEAYPADRCETVSVVLGSWSDRPRRLHNSKF